MLGTPELICSKYKLTRLSSPEWVLLDFTDFLAQDLFPSGGELFQTEGFVRSGYRKAFGRGNVRHEMAFVRLRDHTSYDASRKAVWDDEAELGKGAFDYRLDIADVTTTTDYYLLRNLAIESWQAGAWEGNWSQREFKLTYGIIDHAIVP